MKVIYEDNHLLVVYKPYGILAQADGSIKPDILTLAKAYLKEKYQKPGNVYLGLVHRLDINTEGIMVLAKTSKAAKRLSADIAQHDFEKKYLAVVEGLPQGSTLETYLSKNENERKAYVTGPDRGKLAKLSFKVLRTWTIANQLLSIVDISLETGRFHQIRCQFAHSGHPLYGDTKYGSKNIVKTAVLQAYSLSFRHPISKEMLTFTDIDYSNIFKGIEGIIWHLN